MVSNMGIRNTLHLLHVSDTHLGYRQYGLYERERDLYEAFQEVIDIAIHEHVDAVMHSGDFFDTTRPPMWALRHAIEALTRLKEQGIPVICIMGDHDIPKRRELPPLYFLEELGLLRIAGRLEHNKPLPLHVRARGGSLVVYGIFNHRGVRKEALREKLAHIKPADETSILALHQTLREVSPEYEITLYGLPRGFAYYALGHIHVHKEFHVGSAMAVYPGSIEVLRVDELGERKSVVLAELGKKETINIQRIYLESIRPQILISIDLEELQEKIEELQSKIVNYHKKPIIHLTVRGDPGKKRNVYSILEKRLTNKVLSYRLSFIPVKEEYPELHQIKHSIDIKELLVNSLKDIDKAELALQLIQVLGYGSPTTSIEEAKRITIDWFKKKHGVEP